MKWFKQMSLTKKFVIGMNAIVIVFMTAFTYFNLRQINNHSHEFLEKKIENFGKFMQKASGHLVWNFDMKGLEAYANELKKDEDIAYVNFFDKDNKPMIELVKKSGQGFTKKSNILSPKDDAVIGTLEIGYFDYSVQRLQKESFITTVGGAIGFQLILTVFLILGVQKTTSSLEKQLERLRVTATETTQASHVLQEVSEDLARRGTSQAAAVQETSATLTEIASIVKVNADNAANASKEASHSYQIAQVGQKEIGTLNQAMSEISASARKIQEITNVVDDIAFQTNLLALNASVEAARAGEQGKGFAVVAEAVRALAQRSAAAAKDISLMIKESANKIETGSKIVEKNTQVFNEIVESAGRVKDFNEQIAASSVEQSSGISQITQTMGEIDLTTNQAAQTSAEAQTQAERLSQQAEQLNSIIQSFEGEIKGAA